MNDRERDRPTVEFKGCRAIKATKKAVLVEIPRRDDRWIPKSCIHDNSEVFRENTSGTLVVFEWWAEKEGMI